MTKSTITDERIASVIERLEHFASNLKWTDVRGAQDLLTAADGLRELQERPKTDSEPVAWTENCEITNMQATGLYLRGFPDNSHGRDIPLYRHAQPAPVVSEDLYKLANHIASSKNGLPDEWQDWAEELESDIRRAAMLQAEPVTTANKLGNSPVIPDGYVMVPVEPNGDMLAAAQDAYGENDGDIASTLRAAIAAAPQEVKGE
uniref:hypothetical protein n=1 Tax=Klebsiella aerogenes TaxID=548 RepID=UPI001F2AFE35|nr:hypothetical protein [Klebsiella aerogenes]